MASFLFPEIDDELARTSGKWVDLLPQTPVEGDRGGLIRVTLKVLQEMGFCQAFEPSAPPLHELEVMCSTLMEP